MKLSALWRHLQPNLTPPDACAHAAKASDGMRCDRLDLAALGQPCEVLTIHTPEGSPDWARWLSEIGFIPGESATVRARSPWGDGALVVRIGMSNFALRREEAACVAIKPL
jgi:ferrous iron transport protein A